MVTKYGLLFSAFLTVVFVILKLLGFISWNWIHALLPILLMIGIVIASYTVAAVIELIKILIMLD